MAQTQAAGPKRGSVISWAALGLFALATAWVVLRSGSPASPAPTTTAGPQVIIVPVTVTSTPSRTPLSVPTRSLRPTRTPAPTQTATPTATLYPSPTRLVVPSVPAAGASLALHTPDPAVLLQVIVRGLGPSEGSYQDDNRLQSAISANEAYNAQTLAAADVKRNFAGGLPAVGSVMTSTHEIWSGWPSDGLMQLLRAAAIRYVLDRPGDILQDGHVYTFGKVNLEAHLLEMDGDAGREWLVAVTFNHYHVKDWLLFDEDTLGRPTSLPAPWPPYYDGHQPVEFDAAHDFTDDGRAEIVIVVNHYWWGRAWADAFIYHWRGSGWHLVGSPGLPSGPTGWDISSEYTLEDVNADGRTDMRVTTPVWLGFNCQYDTVTDYVWNGSAIEAADPVVPLPDLSGCTIYAALHSANPDERIAGFEKALTQSLGEGAEPDAVAWIRVQLAMQLAGEGRQTEAETMLQAAAQTDGDGGYLALLRRAVAELGLSPLPVCDALYRQAQESQAGMGTDIDEDLSYGGYPMTYQPSPESVCPLEGLMAQLLNKAALQTERTPAEALAAAGLTIALEKSLNLDMDPEPEWVSVLTGALGQLLIFDKQGTAWSLTRAEVGGQAGMALEALWTDGTDQADLLLVQPFVAAYGGFDCAVNQTTMILTRLTHQAGRWRVAAEKYLCADPALLDLTDPTHIAEVVALLDAPDPQEVESESEPAWMQLEGFAGNAPEDMSLLAYVEQLQADTLARRLPLGTQQAITALIAYLPADDPQAQRVAVRLRYLSGLGYELAGDAPAALDAYAVVLAQAPSSLWAWLAWARVGPE